MPLSDVFVAIIKRAVCIRYDNGEGTLEEIISSYPKLTEDQASSMLEELIQKYEEDLGDDDGTDA